MLPKTVALAIAASLCLLVPVDAEPSPDSLMAAGEILLPSRVAGDSGEPVGGMPPVVVGRNPGIDGFWVDLSGLPSKGGFELRLRQAPPSAAVSERVQAVAHMYGWFWEQEESGEFLPARYTLIASCPVSLKAPYDPQDAGFGVCGVGDGEWSESCSIGWSDCSLDHRYRITLGYVTLRLPGPATIEAHRYPGSHSIYSEEWRGGPLVDADTALPPIDLGS